MPTNRSSGSATSSPADKPGGSQAVFLPQFREDLRWWTREQPRVADRIWAIIEEIVRTPFTGIGKPERVRYFGSDVRSRRITQEHRLIYVVYHDRIDFLQARYHYGDD